MKFFRLSMSEQCQKPYLRYIYPKNYSLFIWNSNLTGYPVFCYCYFWWGLLLFLGQIWQFYFLYIQGSIKYDPGVPSPSGSTFLFFSSLSLTSQSLFLRFYNSFGFYHLSGLYVLPSKDTLCFMYWSTTLWLMQRKGEFQKWYHNANANSPHSTPDHSPA